MASQPTTLLPPASAPRDGPVKREVAHRVFAQEFNSSRHQIAGAGEKDPSYLVSPTGAKVNRLHVVGVCTEVEQVGKQGEMWRARISDPTGVFTVMAGSYQPEASHALSQLQVPCFVAVTGKARTYEPEPGQVFVSIRPESVAPADEATRNHWVVDTAKRTLERIEATNLARTQPGITADDLVRKGIPRPAAEGALAALEPYAMSDMKAFSDMVRKALGYLQPGAVMPVHAAQSPATAPIVTVTPAAPAPAPAPANAKPAKADTAAEDAVDATVLASVQKLEGTKGARWDDVVNACATGGLNSEGVEESLNRLMDKGLVYEPTLGVLRST